MTEAWDLFVASFGGRLVETGLRFAGALIILIAGLYAVRPLLRALRGGAVGKRLAPSARSFICSFLDIGLKALVILLSLTVLGIPGASIVALIGSAGLALGLALQGSLSNIAGGLIIMAFKPFSIGDYVSLEGESGTVTDVGIFFTALTTPDNRRIIVPNGQISSKQLINASAEPVRRIETRVSAPYGARADDVFRLLMDAAASVDTALQDPAPAAMLDAFSDSAVVYTLHVYCVTEEYLETKWALNAAVKRAFDDNGLSFPFPQLDVHVHNRADEKPQ